MRLVYFACFPRFVNIVLSCVIALSSLFGFYAIFPGETAAAAIAARWTEVNIPSEGAVGGWTLAPGSDIQHLTTAPDGTLYAYGSGLTNALYKSSDGGLSWAGTGQVQSAITGIAVSPGNPESIYYTTSSALYHSTDGGRTFLPMPPVPEVISENKTITSLAVTWLSYDIIAVGTKDTDSLQYGNVFTFEMDLSYLWIDTGIGAYDVYALAFSPNYAADRQLTAVVTDESDTFVMSKIGNSAWNAIIGSARLDKDNSGAFTPVPVTRGAKIVFPGSYNGMMPSADRYFYIGIDTGTNNGDVYKVECHDAPDSSLAYDLNAGAAYGENNTDITGLAIQTTGGTTFLAAGCANNARIFTSIDSGLSWGLNTKAPTGSAYTEVVLTTDFAVTGRLYAATSGPGSALSLSRDSGRSWNQLSFIDTTITGIIDFAPSPTYNTDSTLFMVTTGGSFSLWQTRDNGINWERILSSDSTGIDCIQFTALSSRYGSDNSRILAAGISGNMSSIWESDDNGQTFLGRNIRDPLTGSSFPIDTWEMAANDTLFMGSYDGLHGQIFQTINNGFFFQNPIIAGNNTIASIAISPNYTTDGTILVGNTNGGVYLSNDWGLSYQPIPLNTTIPPLIGNVVVSFDTAFASNGKIYALTANTNGRIYRFTLGESNFWESIDTTLPAGSIPYQLCISDGGILYAVNNHANDGMERSLNPRAANPSFETVADGLSDGSILVGLWQCGSYLWTIDTVHCKLLSYQDTLTSPVVRISPVNNSVSIGSLANHCVKNIVLDWDTMDGATTYEWQCSPDNDFSSVPSELEGTTASSDSNLPPLDPATIYHWRVRAATPVFSPWTPSWSFATSLDTEIVTLKPESPTAGVQNINIKPVFQWTGVIGAESYDLLIARDIDFSEPVVTKIGEFAVPTNVWQCDISLENNTTYFWKVRATAFGTSSSWSSSGVFTTEPLPGVEALPVRSTPQTLQDPTDPKVGVPQPGGTVTVIYPPPASVTPPYSQFLDLPQWLKYLVGGLVLIVILALTIILMVVLKIKRI